MKKSLLIILCIISVLTLTACNTKQVSDISVSASMTSKSTTVHDETNSKKNKDHDTDTQSNDVKRLFLSYSGINMDITTKEEKISEFFNLQQEVSIPKTKFNTKFVDITAVYEDDTKEVCATIYIGEDNGYYLQFVNSNPKGAAYKMTNSSFSNDLF